jgi:hypothetical protein
MAIDLDRTTLLLAGAAMLALAAVILAVRPGRGINRALAALVAARGATTLLPQVSNDPAWTATAVNVQPYFALAVVPLALYCLYAFTHAGQPARSPSAGWITLGAIACLDLAYFLDHGLLHTLAPGSHEVGALRATDDLHYTAFGPLWVVGNAASLVLAWLGLRLALQARVEADSPHGPLLLLVASGLTLGALFEGASRLAALTALLDAPGAFPWLPWGWASAVLPIFALVPAGLAVAVLAAGIRSQPAALRPVTRTVVALSGFAFFSGFLRLLAPADSDVGGTGLVPVLLGLWRLAMPILVTYAIVRHPVRDPVPGRAAGAAEGTRQPLDPLPSAR